MGLGVDEMYVYWVTTPTRLAGRGSLWRLLKARTSSASAIATGFPCTDPSAIRITSTHIYWVATECSPSFVGPCHPFRCCQSQVLRYEKATGQTRLIVEERQNTVLDIAVDDRDLYWTTERALKRSQPDGTGQRVAADSPGRPQGMGLDSDYVYWLNPQFFTDVISPQGLVLRLRR